MQSVTSATAVATTAHANSITLFASLELSKSKWVVTINSPGSEKFSKHVVEGGDGACLLDLLSRSRAKAEQRYGVQIKAIVIQEAGLDGFWIHRLLLANGIESHVVDAASIAVARRHRRAKTWGAKTDAIDGETLLRTLMAWARGERRVCSMVRAPSPEDEDRRRLTRERGTLLKERIQHTNRVRGLLSGQGVRDYNPLRRDRFERLEALRTGDGRELPAMLKAEIRRELDRIALVTTQLAAVERARDALIHTDAEERNNPAALLLKLKGLGPEFASLLWLESLFRSFGNRRQVAAYGGLAPRRRVAPGRFGA
jgi:transposase